MRATLDGQGNEMAELKIELGTARYKLIGGPYLTPKFKLGDRVRCLMRGEVTIVGLSDSRIPWPIGKTKRAKSFVIFKDLETALRLESATAICHWWGVTPQTVTVWRKALGVQRQNEGTTALKAEYGSHPDFRKTVLAKAHAKAQDPVRCAKIAQSKRGVKRPPEVIEAMRRANLGRKLSDATRAKLRAANKGISPETRAKIVAALQLRAQRRRQEKLGDFSSG